MNWFLAVLKKYAVFSGRAQRAEYWYFVLFYLIIIMVLAFLDAMTGTFSEESGIGLLSGVFSLATLIPTLAVSVRRLHDTGRSGWWLLLSLIPLIGTIVLLVFFVQDSAAGDNAYGLNPKAIAA